MKHATLFATAALITLGLTGAASAAWDPIVTIDVDYGRDYDSAYTEFAGPLERLRFAATDADVHCRFIRVTFENGENRDVFSGDLVTKKLPAIIDLPGDERFVEKIDFNCSTASTSGAGILVSGDLGSYRETWLRTPYWADQWKHNVGADPERWVSIGSEEFTGPRDRETEIAGHAGRSVSAVALQPKNGDVVCPVVRGRFGEGNSRDLNLDWGEYLEEGSFYWIDLPGNFRNLLQVDMVCRTVGAEDVTIELFVAQN